MTKAIIVDASSFGGNLREKVKEALTKGIVKIVLGEGSTLKFELQGKGANTSSKNESGHYREFSRQGFFYFICGESVNRKEEHLRRLKLLKSNDAHVIALAIVSGANILVSNDVKLINDFKKCNTIDKKSNCIRRSDNIDRLVVKPDSPDDKKVMRLLKEAKVKYERCDCMINGVGC